MSHARFTWENILSNYTIVNVSVCEGCDGGNASSTGDQVTKQETEDDLAADNDVKPSTTTIGNLALSLWLAVRLNLEIRYDKCFDDLTERHISIQTTLDGLESLVDLNGGQSASNLDYCWNENVLNFIFIHKLHTQWKLSCHLLHHLSSAGRKACPLCPEEKFKACYSHKLRRHLQNLHWKVFVEFEGEKMRRTLHNTLSHAKIDANTYLMLAGQKMCICHLPCRNLKPSLSGDQVKTSTVTAVAKRRISSTTSFLTFSSFK